MTLDLTPSAAQTALRDRVRTAFEPFRGWFRERRSAELTEDAWRALAGTGFFQAAVVAGRGEAEPGTLGLVLALEELGASGLGNMLPVLTATGTLAVARHGEPCLADELGPALAAGERKICLALTEAEAGFNTFRIATLARRDGDRYRVQGSKVYVSGADIADHMLLLARSVSVEELAERGLQKTAGLTWLLVAPGAAGVSRRRLPTHGEHALSQHALELDDVEVPVHYRIGDEGGGLKVLLDLMNAERILVSAMLVGTARYCLDLACDHARERRVFGDTPIGAYQAVQHPLAELAVRLEATRLMVYRAARRSDRGAPGSEVGTHANAAKLLAGELGVQAVEAALGAFGGKGFDERYGIAHLIESVRLLEMAPISPALLLNHLAERELNLPRSY
jgi:alkylation response protein AidB-like acyl-CoA dehydrogenase